MNELSSDKYLIGPWVCERTGGVFTPDDSVAIGVLRDGKIAGGVMFNNWMKNSICMHAAGVDKRWLSRKALAEFFSYPFRQLMVKKVIAPVDADNEESANFVEHVGFRLEARIKDAAISGKDLLIYTMTPLQCKWLGD